MTLVIHITIDPDPPVTSVRRPQPASGFNAATFARRGTPVDPMFHEYIAKQSTIDTAQASEPKQE